MASTYKQNLEQFHQLDIILEQSIMYLGSKAYTDGDESGTDFLMAESAIKNLLILDQKGNDITIIMNNIGGCFYHALAIYDAIKACKNNTIMIGYGNIMSAGALIMQAADKRILSPNTYVLIHDGTDGFYGHSVNLERAGEQSKKMRKLLHRLLSERSILSHRQMAEKCKFDTFLSAREAVNLGLADGVLGEED